MRGGGGGGRRGGDMDLMIGFDQDPLIATIHHLMDFPDEMEKTVSAPTRAYVRDCKAMASTPADVKEVAGKVVFEIDMPGIKPSEIKVQVEDNNTLVVSGERKRGPAPAPGEETKEGTGAPKYVRMERRMGKFMRRFQLPDDANLDSISAACQDGVLTVTVEKIPPPEPKKPKSIEVKMGAGSSSDQQQPQAA